jgi:hypothetical protein
MLDVINSTNRLLQIGHRSDSLTGEFLANFNLKKMILIHTKDFSWNK